MLKFLFFIIIISLVFRVITRWILPMFLKSFLGRMTDRMSGASDQFNQNSDNRSEGEVIIENKSAKENSSDQSTNGKGDYVDFEEVEE
ncbi:MAG: hypothetical protein ACI8XB_000523 [Patiriisocius sp.]|jgi:hypothetical protein